MGVNSSYFTPILTKVLNLHLKGYQLPLKKTWWLWAHPPCLVVGQFPPAGFNRKLQKIKTRVAVPSTLDLSDPWAAMEIVVFFFVWENPNPNDLSMAYI